MGTWRAEYPEIAELDQLSNSELVAVYDTKEEADKHIKQQVFSNMQRKTAKHYRSLSPRNRETINKLIQKFVGTTEHQGFNLDAFLFWMEKSGVDLLAIATHIADAEMREVIGYIQEVPDPKDIARRIEYFKGTKTLQTNEKGTVNVVNALSNSIIFSPELILKGCGILELVKPDVLKKYNESPDFYLPRRDRGTGTLIVPVREELSDFAKYIGRTWDEIVDVKYGVIDYTYGYKFLEDAKDTSKKEMVDYLIEELYSQEQALKRSERATKKLKAEHKKLFKELYARVDSIGIEKGDFNTLAILFDAIHKS